MKKIVLLSSAAISVLTAAAYKLPEQSVNSMALSAAYVAHTTQADTAYFNPANMAFMGEKQYADGAVTLINSAPMGDFRWGVSVVVPGGLSKRWDEQPGKLFAQEFTLENVELNPVFSYKINEQFAVGGGLRVVYSSGVVKSDGRDGTPYPIARDMKGDTFEFGYNLAFTYRPTEDINVGVTYRSNIDLTEKGKANLYLGSIGTQYDATVTVPLPAALNIAVSKTWEKTFTLEFGYERTYWSTYKQLDFQYSQPVTNPTLKGAFDTPIPKNWKDTNTYKIGATMVMDRITVMMGFAIDETPIPDETLSFELPDSDAKVFSMGFRYQQTENLSWGAAFLYDAKEARSIAKGVSDNPVINANGASFSGGGAYLTTLGLSYEF